MKPMLATDAVAEKIRYPVLASVKVDGVRAIAKGGVALSRTLKPIPNEYIQSFFRRHEQLLEGLDGELVVGPENAKDVMQKTMSGVMRREGQPDFQYLVFDRWDQSAPYKLRNERLSGTIAVARSVGLSWIHHLEQIPIYSSQALAGLEAKALEAGFEGLMIRDPDGPYKFGRSTVKEGILLKVKQFDPSEAEVIGVDERMHNANEATRDELGRTKRSTTKSGLVAAGDLGALVVRDLVTGVVFNIGTGFTAQQRRDFWAWALTGHDGQRQVPIEGQIVKYKSFAATGVKEAPRFPVFLGFRHAIDIGDPE